MYETCMKYKCKVCPKAEECEKRLKEQHLTYKPFENLLEILKEKGVIICK